MNLNDIRTTVSFDELWVLPLSGTITPNLIGRIRATDAKDIFHFITGQEVASIKLRDSEFCMDLNFQLKRGCAHLAQVMQGAKDGSFVIKICFFRADAIEMDIVEVGIDRRIEETAKRHENFNSQDALLKILTNKCIISDGKNTWFIVKAGHSGEDDDSEDSADRADNALIKTKTAFSIWGDGFTIPVTKRSLDETTEIFFATKIVYKNNPDGDGSLILAKGSLIFSSLAKRIQPVAAAALQRLEAPRGGYLAAWDRYGQKEGDLLLRKARDIGTIRYSRIEKTGVGFKFYADEDIPEALNENDELELVKPDELPPYLSNLDMTWEKYSDKLEEEFKKRRTQRDQAKQVSSKKRTGTQELSEDDNDSTPEKRKDEFKNKSFGIAGIADRSITLKGLDIEPPADRLLALSIMGDLIQIERRMKARIAVKEGLSANPLLGLIIEEGGILPEIGRVTKLKPLSPFVKEKIFNKNLPTERQKKAIDIALNTPDIALIQGPPGTGKTTVITAILERLNEEYDKRNSIRGKILVSGFQHDAVDNIISRLSINSLPTIKFGRRPGESEENESINQLKIEQWIKETTEEIQKRNPQIQPLEKQKELQVLFRQYMVTPAKNIATSIIDLVLSLPRRYVTEDIVAGASAIRQSLQTEEIFISKETKVIIAKIRSLRTTDFSFIDDGQYNAIVLLASMHDRLSPEETTLLQKAAAWKEGEALSFLAELKDLQNSLLNRFIPHPGFIIEKPQKEMLGLIEKVNAALSKRRSTSNKKDDILAHFLYELESNPEGIREAVQDYVFVYGATTQGAEGRDIRKAKTDRSSEYMRFDTVIIDEAARVSPRDLLIPMAQAEKRIILVGDHRQLPHIVDDEIIRRAMAEATGGENSEAALDKRFEDYIEHSMFEYLKKRLETLSARDGVTRTITLDEQYRTHPLLGNFINQYFYAPHPRESFQSNLPEEYFRHRLSGMDGKPALWINVGGMKSPEEKAGFSHTRRPEAEAIVMQLKEWIDSDEGKQLTFGIISFYRAQSDIVFEELGKRGITERQPGETGWKIKDEYAYLKKADGKTEERLRVGTVDSFQGMEFDVVFLSIVRSPRHIPNDKKLMIKTFGHLMSENRLCVSMSRQKKILVVAGNADLVWSDIGKTAVPALAAFYDLCKEKGKYYDY